MPIPRPADDPAYWAALEALGRGEAVPAGPGACAECHHGKPHHTPKAGRRPCERCECPSFVEQTPVPRLH